MVFLGSLEDFSILRGRVSLLESLEERAMAYRMVLLYLHLIHTVDFHACNCIPVTPSPFLSFISWLLLLFSFPIGIVNLLFKFFLHTYHNYNYIQQSLPVGSVKHILTAVGSLSDNC